jgi:hypothetical protein
MEWARRRDGMARADFVETAIRWASTSSIRAIMKVVGDVSLGMHRRLTGRLPQRMNVYLFL